MVLEMLEKSIKDLSVLLHKKVSQKILLLLDQELIHNFEEVSTENGQRILVTVEEARELIKQSVILSLHGRNGLFLLILGDRRDLGSSSLIGIASFLSLFSILDILILVAIRGLCILI
jgi:hypothetical protein